MMMNNNNSEEDNMNNINNNNPTTNNINNNDNNRTMNELPKSREQLYSLGNTICILILSCLIILNNIILQAQIAFGIMLFRATCDMINENYTFAYLPTITNWMLHFILFLGNRLPSFEWSIVALIWISEGLIGLIRILYCHPMQLKDCIRIDFYTILIRVNFCLIFLKAFFSLLNIHFRRIEKDEYYFDNLPVLWITHRILVIFVSLPLLILSIVNL